jgi:hypothetical protein
MFRTHPVQGLNSLRAAVLSRRKPSFAPLLLSLLRSSVARWPRKQRLSFEALLHAKVRDEHRAVKLDDVRSPLQVSALLEVPLSLQPRPTYSVTSAHDFRQIPLRFRVPISVSSTAYLLQGARHSLSRLPASSSFWACCISLFRA